MNQIYLVLVLVLIAVVVALAFWIRSLLRRVELKDRIIDAYSYGWGAYMTKGAHPFVVMDDNIRAPNNLVDDRGPEFFLGPKLAADEVRAFFRLRVLDGKAEVFFRGFGRLQR